MTDDARVGAMTPEQREHVIGLLRDAVALGKCINELGTTASYEDVNETLNVQASIHGQLGMWAFSILEMLAGDTWQPIATAPAVGVFLVYLDGPIHDSRIHVLSRLRISNGVMEVMCGHFMGDYPEKPTDWRPLPAPPHLGEGREQQ